MPACYNEWLDNEGSDEELATMLFDYKECNKNCIMNSGKHCYEICEEESVILKWLQQPVKEDT